MNDHLPSFIQRHEQYLRSLLQHMDMAAPELKKAMRYSLLSGGKRFRPLLIYCSAEILDVPLPIRDVLAASVEMMHTYSLIHDDLPAMDNDDFRRGKPTCHRMFGEAGAILAGDALASWSIDLLLERLPRWIITPRVLPIARCLLQASGPQGMVSGQSLDLQGLPGSQAAEKALQTIHQLKTGRLISACIEMVLLAANHDHSECAGHLRSYARDLGLVFQMQDDFLDRFACPTQLGKARSSDAANAKYTYADLLGKEALYREIEKQFRQTVAALEQCGEKSAPLLQLTKQLRVRSLQQCEVETL